MAALLIAGSTSAQEPARSPSAGVVYDTQAAAKLDTNTFAALRSSGGLPYRLLVPPGPAPAAGFPLVLVLHGSGAIGTDNARQLGALALSWALPEVRAEFPAYVVVPQFAARTADYTPGPDGVLQSHANPPLSAVPALVEELAARHAIDRRRIYVTGFSMGASSAWHLLLARPGLFAAAVPIAGIAPPRAAAVRLRGVPILMAHGDADTDNSPASDVAMLAALQAAGNDAARLVMYAGLEHAPAPEILYGRWWRTWLFRQHRHDER